MKSHNKIRHIFIIPFAKKDQPAEVKVWPIKTNVKKNLKLVKNGLGYTLWIFSKQIPDRSK